MTGQPRMSTPAKPPPPGSILVVNPDRPDDPLAMVEVSMFNYCRLWAYSARWDYDTLEAFQAAGLEYVQDYGELELTVPAVLEDPEYVDYQMLVAKELRRTMKACTKWTWERFTEPPRYP